MKLIAAAAAMLVGTVLAVSGADAWRVYTDTGLVMLFSSMKPMTVVRGANQLDSVHSFFCKSAVGCIVVTSASDKEVGTTQTELCTLIDSREGVPGCAVPAGAPINYADEQTNVRQGTHTVQTFVHSYNTSGQVIGWQVNYTVYEIPASATP